MTKLKTLVSLQGKKIVWVGFDQETDGYVVIFDGGEALNISAFEIIEDVAPFVEGILQEKLLDARQTIALETLYTPVDAGHPSENSEIFAPAPGEGVACDAGGN